jgi:hypothetical protein
MKKKYKGKLKKKKEKKGENWGKMTKCTKKNTVIHIVFCVWGKVIPPTPFRYYLIIVLINLIYW